MEYIRGLFVLARALQRSFCCIQVPMNTTIVVALVMEMVMYMMRACTLMVGAVEEAGVVVE